MNTSMQKCCAWGGPVLLVTFAFGWGLLGGFLPPIPPSTDAAGVAKFFQDDTTLIRLGIFRSARPNDMVIGFTTSGTSPTVVKGLAMARSRGACSVAFTSTRGIALAAAADLAIVVPAEETARIQEMHLVALHLVSELVDQWATAC